MFVANAEESSVCIHIHMKVLEIPKSRRAQFFEVFDSKLIS